jgi:hypothetical protein
MAAAAGSRMVSGAIRGLGWVFPRRPLMLLKTPGERCAREGEEQSTDEQLSGQFRPG